MIKKTNFKDLKIITNFIHRDTRGYFKEILLEKKFKKKISIFYNFLFQKKYY